MERLLKRRGSEGHARMLAVEFDGVVRDGTIFQLGSGQAELHEGDLVLFIQPDGGSSGLLVDQDSEGLHSIVSFQPWLHLRIGLEALGEGLYKFRPAVHHIEVWPALGAEGAGMKIG